VNDYERLRRNLHDALPTEPDFPSPRLMNRIMENVSAPRRRGLRTHMRRRPWLAAVAALTLVGLLGQPLSARLAELRGVGRVEFLATDGNGRVEFVSSQAQPAAEYRAMTEQVLAGFNGTPDFNSQPTAAQDIERIRYEQATGRSTVDLVALTRGDMAALQASGALEDLTPLLRRLQRDRQFAQTLLDDGRFDTSKQYSIPWLQATYMMVVNRQALRYLPPGADVDHLTYDQLIVWGQRMQAATGEKLIGLPADLNGPRGGLIYRFLQGYAYPSFTGTTLTGFRSPGAVQMWDTLRRLWSVTNDWSTHYDNMDAPLKTGEVWVAWDHQARLAQALKDDQHFLAVPAPSGPMGLGYMSAVVGLAIPRGAPNQRGAEALIDWLTRPSQQAAAGASLGFFPVVQGIPLSGAQAAEARVARLYQADRDGRETLLPEGLGSKADAVTAIYQKTFERIVLQNEDTVSVLNEETTELQRLLNDVKAPCWPPDPRSSGPCQIS
jgi:multiple sugar transport system substrate-binding protein